MMGTIAPPRHVRIFLASPGDVREEREAARSLLLQLERAPFVRGRFTIEVVSWDDPDAPTPMLATLSPQDAVRRSLPKPSECDVTVAIFWDRMGTPLNERRPDGRRYLSGTEWEFEDAFNADKPILLYRRVGRSQGTQDTENDKESTRQRELVDLFFGRFAGPGGTLVGGFTTYETVDEFTDRLRKDVESFLEGLDKTGPGKPRSWIERVRHWRLGQLLLAWLGGSVTTTLCITAVTQFAEVAANQQSVPISAYVAKYALIALAVSLPLLLVTVTWIWFGRSRR